VSSAPTLAAPDSPSSDPPRLHGRWPRRVLWANLVAQIGIIVTGGAVRLTGSGLGCSTWPQCEPGQFTPVFHEETAAHAFIEFGNRTMTGVLGVIALALAWVVWRDHLRPSWYRRLGLVPLIGVVVQALIGGVTVLARLHPAVVGVHMLVSLGLVAASAALLALDGRAWPTRPTAPLRLPARALLAVGAALMVLGTITTGSGPHGGDDEYAARYELDPVLVAKAHAWAVWVFLGLLVVCLVLLRRAGAAEATRSWTWLLVVTLAQGAIGYVQYFTGLPEVVVGTHLLGTGVLTAVLTWAYLRLPR
jgi:heme a synthase